MRLSLHFKIWVCTATLVLGCAVSAHAQGKHSNSISVVASTVPANGDVNPYGIARVPRSTGSLIKGNILVSNFNSSANLQGTGTTIVQIAPDGTSSLFCSNRWQQSARSVPGWSGLDYCPRGAE